MSNRKLNQIALHASRKREEGQPTTDFAVALASITVASVSVLPGLGNAVPSAVDQVTGLLP
jgi:hypothetical protein